jgi:hypothetical protein
MDLHPNHEEKIASDKLHQEISRTYSDLALPAPATKSYPAYQRDIVIPLDPIIAFRAM